MSSVSIELSRTRCDGTCPAYDIVITGDGAVRYVGHAYVHVKEERVASIDRDAVRKLLDEFRKLDFLHLKSAYKQSITDMPSTVISLTTGTSTKRVLNYWRGDVDNFLEWMLADVNGIKMHQRLDALADAIDRVSGSGQWVNSDHDAALRSEADDEK